MEMEYTKGFIKRVATHEANIAIEQAQLLLKYQALDKINTVHFFNDMQRIVEKSSILWVDQTMEWIKTQQTNTLPNLSSGSFLTALTDVDGLMNYFGDIIEEIFGEDEKFYDEIYTLLRTILNKRL